MLEAAGPLALISAQGLWVTQPILSLVVPADEVGGLARLLETEDGCHWLCNALLTEPDAAERNGPEHDKGG
jgi:hypothetical protein